MTQSIQIDGNITPFFNIRAAIKAASSGQTILIGTGLYDIRSSATAFSPTPVATLLKNPNTFARFGAKTLTFSGSGSGSDPEAATIITGNARIYTQQSDRSSGIPVGINFKDLRFSYGETFPIGASTYRSPSGSGYILQSGVKTYTLGVLSGISSRIKDVSLDGVTFAGIHSGAVGTNGGAPFGNYMDVAVSGSITLKNINVALTGQGGGTRFASNSTTYGSAFLLANGPQITITDSRFDEAGYRNSLALWGEGTLFATNVTITGNTFTRSGNQSIRTAGETLSNVSGTVSGNTFEQGAYLDLQKSGSKSLAITGNTFSLLQGGFGVVVRSNQVAADLASVTLTDNTFTGGLAVKSELTAPDSVLTFGSNKVNGVVFDGLLVGGGAADIITGTSAKEWISGGGGNDTITTGGGADAIVFSDLLSVDTVNGYNTASNTIQLEDAVFQTPALLTQAPNGADLDLLYNGTKFASLTGLASSTVVGTSQIVFF